MLVVDILKKLVREEKDRLIDILKDKKVFVIADESEVAGQKVSWFSWRLVFS